jgi:hypothetical protein
MAIHKAVDHVDSSLVTTLALFSVARMNALITMDFNWPGTVELGDLTRPTGVSMMRPSGRHRRDPGTHPRTLGSPTHPPRRRSLQ